MKTILGIKKFDILEYAISGNAILGIRDSGKTYAGCEAAEELFDAQIPSICIDPIGKWHSLRVPGKGKGYPFVVAGGRFGDLPLTRKNCGDLVRGAMADGISLVIDLFSRDMTKTDWRYIVQQTMEILLFENEDFGLRHVFIEEAGEFVPQIVKDGATFSAVEKVVRMGGNSKLGCTLIHQRPADINKSVLELCANIVLLRQQGKNTITDLKKWFVLVAPDKAAEIGASLPDLRSGDGWAFIHDLPDPIRFKVPPRNSKHPDRRESSAKAAGKPRAAVPATEFVEAMKAKLAPKASPVVAAAKTSKPGEKINTADQKANERALAAAREEGAEAVRASIPAMLDAQHRSSFDWGLRIGIDRAAQAAKAVQLDIMPERTPNREIKTLLSQRVPHAPVAQRIEPRNSTPVVAGSNPAGRTITQPPSDGLTAPQQRMLDTIAFWNATGEESPTIEQVAAVCGYSFKASTRRVVAGALVTSGLVHYPEAGRMALTPSGMKLARAMSADDAAGKLRSVLTGPQLRVVEILREHGREMPRDDLIAAAGYSPNASTHRVVIGALSTLKIIHYPSQRVVALAPWAEEVLR